MVYALTNKSTKDLDISNDVKIFIQEAINIVYGFAINISLDDIPLIKVIYYKINEKDSSKII